MPDAATAAARGTRASRVAGEINAAVPYSHMTAKAATTDAWIKLHLLELRGDAPRARVRDTLSTTARDAATAGGRR